MSIRTFKKNLDESEFDKVSYIDIEDGYYSETVVDDGSGFPNPSGWYETFGDERFIRDLLKRGYEEL